MPRRDALNEKKREQLAQENELLQKLMLQARSSVRRSSLKEQREPDITLPETMPQLEQVKPEEKEPPVLQSAMPQAQEIQKEEPATEKELFQKPIVPHEPERGKQPLTENDLFPAGATVPDSRSGNRLLTENDIFSASRDADVPKPQKTGMVRVILPNQNVAAAVAHPINERAETVERQHNRIMEAPAVAEEHAVIEQDQAVIYSEDLVEKRNKARTGTYLLLLVALLAGFGGYYLYTSQQNKQTTIPSERSTPVAKQESSQEHTSEQVPPKSETDVTDDQSGNTTTENNAAEKKITTPAITPPTTAQEKAQPDANTEASEKPLSELLKDFDNVTVVENKATEKSQGAQPNRSEATEATSNDGLGKYKVLSKAYFHNEPDESTRRKAFIIHWNNAVLTPLDEENGFVYIVFTNHLGQTSKGWLRKTDLQRIE